MHLRRSYLMASIARKPNGWLVRWREGGKQLNRYFKSDSEAVAFKAYTEDRLADASIGIDLVMDERNRPFIEHLARQARKPQIRAEAMPTLQDYALQLASSKDLSSGSRRFYATAIRTHVGGTKLGRLPLNQIRPIDVQTWWDSLDAGDGARRAALRTVGKTLAMAERLGIIQANPLKRTLIRGPGRRRHKELTILEPAQVQKLAAHASSDLARVCILVAAYGGFRAGEVGGLRVQDVDFDSCRVSVRQATYRNGGDAGIGPTKTMGSQRTIKLARQACDALRDYVSRVEPWKDGRIFYSNAPGYKGGTIDHIGLNRWTQQAAKRAGLPPVNFHALRHTCAALLIRAGVPVKAIQHQLGHTNITMTMQVYGHLMAGFDEPVGAALEAAFEEGRSGKIVRLPV
jgi:integrase